MAEKFLNFRAVNPITGFALGMFCTEVCSKPLSECPLYKALKADTRLNVGFITNKYGKEVINVDFPSTYDKDFLAKEYKRFKNIAIECAKKQEKSR